MFKNSQKMPFTDDLERFIYLYRSVGFHNELTSEGDKTGLIFMS